MHGAARVYRGMRIVWLVLVLACLAAAGAAWAMTAPRPAFSSVAGPPAPPEQGDAEKGRLIFAAGDCASCHASPGQPDRLKLGGGLALASPYGTLFVPNISSDSEDGIGRWKVTDLANALLSGVSPDGRHYYPAFPYASYAHMKAAEISDLMAYLRTLAPVKNRPPPHDLAFPFTIRRFVGFWKILYFDRSTIIDDPLRDTAWNRGRYLVNAQSHCAECHSSRDIFGGIEEKTRFAGGPDPEGVGYYPNITPTGIGHWSDEQIVRVLTDGHTPDGRIVGSSMADVVTNTAMLPASDRAAIATYLKSLPSKPTPQP